MVQPSNYYTPNGTGTSTNSSNSAWGGIDPRLQQLYQSYGVNTPGAQGSGFTDASYWNGVLQKTGDWGYVSGRLGSDLSGKGPDTPGSGDVGNTSGNSSNSMNSMFPSWLSSFFNNMQQQQQRQNTLGWRQQWAQRANQKPIYANSTTTPINRFGGY